jgi:hypothetical protein
MGYGWVQLARTMGVGMCDIFVSVGMGMGWVPRT